MPGKLGARMSVAQQQLSRDSRADAKQAETLPLVYSGWMSKKGGVRRSWARRWFELRGDFLLRRESEAGPFVGSIHLPSCEAVRVSQAPAAKQHELELFSPERTVRLQCESDGQMRQWLDLTQPLVAGARGRAEQLQQLARKQLAQATGEETAAQSPEAAPDCEEAIPIGKDGEPLKGMQLRAWQKKQARLQGHVPGR